MRDNVFEDADWVVRRVHRVRDDPVEARALGRAALLEVCECALRDLYLTMLCA